jgi:hypothetical protein
VFLKMRTWGGGSLKKCWTLVLEKGTPETLAVGYMLLRVVGNFTAVGQNFGGHWTEFLAVMPNTFADVPRRESRRDRSSILKFLERYRRVSPKRQGSP